LINDLPNIITIFLKLLIFKDKIFHDFQRFTQYTRNPNISRTTSCNENYYRQTLPEELKENTRQQRNNQLFTKTNGKLDKKHRKTLKPNNFTGSI
jgi:hypothetical protein